MDVQKMVLQWVAQDLKCAKCKRPRVNDFMEHCSCAGEWVATVDWEETRERLRVYEHVGRCFGFGMVVAAVEELGVI